MKSIFVIAAIAIGLGVLVLLAHWFPPTSQSYDTQSEQTEIIYDSGGQDTFVLCDKGFWHGLHGAVDDVGLNDGILVGLNDTVITSRPQGYKRQKK